MIAISALDKIQVEQLNNTILNVKWYILKNHTTETMESNKLK